MRQLLDLEPVWSAYDHFFVTEDTPLGQSLRRDHRTYFVPHVAWGQAKLGAPLRMVARGAESLARSAAVMARERPDVIITTGAGAVFFAVLFGKLAGAHVVAIESFARFERPSLFGRLVAPWANDLVAQSPRLAEHYPKAKIFDPLRVLDEPPPEKKPLLFATVGATLPFDRLVRSVATLKARGDISEEVVLQTGVGGWRPDGVPARESLAFDEVQGLLKEASIVVCHGGTGSIITALRQGCHVVAMPRRSDLGEHYDDHQLEIVAAFEKRGLVDMAETVDDLQEALTAARRRARVSATTDPAELIAFLRALLDDKARALASP